MTFQLDDRVRIVRLLIPEREVSCTAAGTPPPRLGDMVTVVADVGDGFYLVESFTDDGISVWAAEFAAKELELVERADGGE